MDENLQKGRSYLLFILARRDYSKATLANKLRSRKYNEEDIKKIIDSLIVDGLFKESRYAEVRTRQLLKKGLGVSLVKAKLKLEKCSVDNSTIEEALAESGGDSTLRIREIIQKQLRRLRRGTDVDPKLVKEKITKTLLSKGHRYSDFSKILSEEI